MFERVCNYIKFTRGLYFTVRDKGESNLMKFIGFLLFFNPSFMTNYTTTIGSTVYFPDGYTVRQPEDAARTMGHEGYHLEQIKKHGRVKFSLQYLFPQVLAAFALLALLAFVWLPMLWCLCFLVFLAPLPAPWRVKYEREAYLVTAVLDAARGWDITSDWYEKYQVNHYTAWGYYKPAWFSGPVKKFVREDMLLAEKIARGEVPHEYITPLLTAMKGQ